MLLIKINSIVNYPGNTHHVKNGLPNHDKPFFKFTLHFMPRSIFFHRHFWHLAVHHYALAFF